MPENPITCPWFRTSPPHSRIGHALWMSLHCSWKNQRKTWLFPPRTSTKTQNVHWRVQAGETYPSSAPGKLTDSGVEFKDCQTPLQPATCPVAQICLVTHWSQKKKSCAAESMRRIWAFSHFQNGWRVLLMY